MTRVPTHRLSPATSATSTDTSDDWRHRAACHGHDPELWFAQGTYADTDTTEAKRVCATCPVIDTCLRWALDTSQEHGVWGGLDEQERRAIRRHHARTAGPTSGAPTREAPDDPAKTRPTERPTCGTHSGYTEHTRKRERQCDACRAWKAAHRGKAATDTCGTTSGYRRHQDRKEAACGPCKTAKAEDSARYRRRNRNAA